MFVYIDGHYFVGDAGSDDKGFDAYTKTAGSDVIALGVTDMKLGSVGDTSIVISTYDSQNMQAGTWKVLQIELPSTMPFYSFLSL